MARGLILGIESSCDETAAAVVENGETVRSSVVASQMSTHGKYGGVVPELASRGAYGSARGVVLRPFVKPAPVRHIGAVWRKSTARKPAIEALCRVIETHAR